jgi:hypothetical protein
MEYEGVSEHESGGFTGVGDTTGVGVGEGSGLTPDIVKLEAVLVES